MFVQEGYGEVASAQARLVWILEPGGSWRHSGICIDQKPIAKI